MLLIALLARNIYQLVNIIVAHHGISYVILPLQLIDENTRQTFGTLRVYVYIKGMAEFNR